MKKKREKKEEASIPSRELTVGELIWRLCQVGCEDDKVKIEVHGRFDSGVDDGVIDRIVAKDGGVVLEVGGA